MTFKLNYLVIITIGHIIETVSGQFQSNCEELISNGCTHRTNFTAEELDKVRKWIQTKYMTEAYIKPNIPACAQLRVRKDFKCMTESERLLFIRTLRKLYANGVMDRLTDIHYGYWPAGHKTADFVPFHRKLMLELEKELMKIDPTVTLPYWGTALDFSTPEKSLLFRYFGTSGTHNNSYCVTDGMLYQNLPANRCVRRQWHLDKYMPPWESPEVLTVHLQNTPSYLILSLQLVGYHFLIHLSVGGYAGDMSVATAPFDILFHLFHNFFADVFAFKIQLGNKDYLVPKSYDEFIKINQSTGFIYNARLATDVITYWANTPVLHMVWLGFGEYCSVTDQIVEDVLNTINKVKPPAPVAISRLPREIQRQYYPKFYSNNYTVFDYYLPNVGNCNQECRPIPMFQSYTANENGLRQMRRYVYDDNLDIVQFVYLSQSYWQTLVTQLNKSNYCSPYVTKVT